MPGKLILAGEHSVVFGGPALVAAVSTRLTASVGRAESGIRIELPDLGYEGVESYASVECHGEEKGRLWRQYAAAPSPQRFARLRTSDPANLVKIALAEVFARTGPGEERALRIRIESELPTGSGLGSSAAVAVAVVASILTDRGIEAEPHLVEDLARAAERFQHGTPSGLDMKAVIQGGVLWSEGRSKEGGLELAAVRVDPAVLEGFAVFDTGRPSEPTGTVVAYVRSLESGQPVVFGQAMATLSVGARSLYRGLVKGDCLRIAEAIRSLEVGLEALGVVPPGITEIVRAIEAEGGAAKVSGAGSLSGPAAPCGPARRRALPVAAPRRRPCRGLRTVSRDPRGNRANPAFDRDRDPAQYRRRLRRPLARARHGKSPVQAGHRGVQGEGVFRHAHRPDGIQLHPGDGGAADLRGIVKMET